MTGPVPGRTRRTSRSTTSTAGRVRSPCASPRRCTAPATDASSTCPPPPPASVAWPATSATGDGLARGAPDDAARLLQLGPRADSGRHRGHVPNDRTVLKVLSPVIRSPVANRIDATGRTTSWKAAPNALTLFHGDRIALNGRRQLEFTMSLRRPRPVRTIAALATVILAAATGCATAVEPTGRPVDRTPLVARHGQRPGAATTRPGSARCSPRMGSTPTPPRAGVNSSPGTSARPSSCPGGRRPLHVGSRWRASAAGPSRCPHPAGHVVREAGTSSRRWAVSWAGASSCSRWPASSIQVRVEWGMRSCSHVPYSGGRMRSWRPHSSRTGMVMVEREPS